MDTQTDRLDARVAVNEAIRRFPETVAVFNEFGIDSCCGGAASIAIAAERDGANLDTLLQRLNAAIENA